MKLHEGFWDTTYQHADRHGCPQQWVPSSCPLADEETSVGGSDVDFPRSRCTCALPPNSHPEASAPTSHFPGLSLSWNGAGPVARGPGDVDIHCLGHRVAGTDSRRRRPFEFPLRANESEAKCNLSVSTILIGQEMVQEASISPAVPISQVSLGTGL